MNVLPLNSEHLVYFSDRIKTSLEQWLKLWDLVGETNVTCSRESTIQVISESNVFAFGSEVAFVLTKHQRPKFLNAISGIENFPDQGESQLIDNCLQAALADFLDKLALNCSNLEPQQSSKVLKETAYTQTTSPVVADIVTESFSCQLYLSTKAIKNWIFAEEPSQPKAELVKRADALLDEKIKVSALLDGVVINFAELSSLQVGDVLSNRVAKNQQLSLHIGKNQTQKSVELVKSNMRLAIKF